MRRLDLEGLLLHRGGQAVDGSEHLGLGILSTGRGADEDEVASAERGRIWAR